MNKKQSLFAPKVVLMAKAMIQAKKEGKQLIIIQKRQTGRRAAIKLSNGEQVLNTNLLNDN